MSKYSLQLRWLVEQTLADAKLPNIEANWHAEIGRASCRERV